MKKLLLTILLLFAIPAQAQWEGPTAVPFAALRDSLGHVDDSLGVHRERLDSLQFMKADSGTVAAGYACFIDSLSYLQLATFSNPQFNRVTPGISTGIAGWMRISGVVAVASNSSCDNVGAPYWLGPGGILIDSIPSALNLWAVKMGSCVADGFLRLDPGPIMRRK